MKIRLPVLCVLLLSVLLCGCASNPNPGDAAYGRDQRLIGKMEKRPPVFPRTAGSAPTRAGAIGNYRAYLADDANTLFRAEVLRRVAALMLEEGESVHGEVTDAHTDAGEQALLASIGYYRAYLEQYPHKRDNDAVLYQLARAHALLGDAGKSLRTMGALAENHPGSEYFEEIQFRRGEILFVFGDYEEAEAAYATIVSKASGASPYRDKAQYKLAWSRFKQEQYIDALNDCVDLLDRMQAQGMLDERSTGSNPAREETDFINEVLRIASLSASYTGGTETIRQVMAAKGGRSYEALMYRNLGEHYLATERTADAAEVFLDYARLYPDTLPAAEFHGRAIEAYASGDFAGLLLATKADYVRRYGTGSEFWQRYDSISRQPVRERLRQTIRDLATHYHAVAVKTGRHEDYHTASRWYGEYVRSFAHDSDTPRMHFLLAETRHGAGHYREALDAYLETAYAYEAHADSAEAGYASVLTYRELIALADAIPPDAEGVESRRQLERDALENAIRFCSRFRESGYAPAVIAATAQQLFDRRDYRRAAAFARSHGHLQYLEDPSFFRTTWLVYAHSLFELQDYGTAETAYGRTLEWVGQDDPLYRDLSERLAASIYRQGQRQRELGQYALASHHFLRIAERVPGSVILATAQYDAAAMQIRLQDWDEAARLLESFRARFPGNGQYAQGVTEKMILVYTRAGKPVRAAEEMLRLSQTADNAEERRSLTWQAAEAYRDIGMQQEANEVFIRYIEKYPRPFPQYMEAHQRVIDYYRDRGERDNLDRWLRSVVQAEKNGGDMRTDRTRFIAGSAALVLAGRVTEEYKRVELTVPLKQSLAGKKSLMQEALQQYSDLMQYGIAEITTESTWRVADIYGHFARALLDSQRPQNLDAEALEQYEILLEEQAYPFEEKAIELHASNARRTRDGLYDDWIRKSMEALSVLQPARYAKTERIDDHVAVN